MIKGVLEASVYAGDVPETAEFYREVLGLEEVFQIEDQHVSFRCGTSVLHVFDPEASRVNESVPPHGADDPTHVCFTVDFGTLSEWKETFEAEGIALEDETTWPNGGTSIYVRDPAGNSIELATPDLWMDRPHDAALLALRPHVPVDTEESSEVETFQHETLRPVLKGINATLLKLVVSYLTKYGTGFARMDRADKIRKVRNLLTQDSRLKRTLVGMAMGHFTEDEFDFYLANRAELRRRMIDLLEERAVSQVDTIAALVEKSG